MRRELNYSHKTRTLQLALSVALYKESEGIGVSQYPHSGAIERTLGQVSHDLRHPTY